MFEPDIDEKLLEGVLKHTASRELAERALAETSNRSIEAAISWLKTNAEADNVLKPSTEKTLLEGSYGVLPYGAAAMQGWRSYMEDVLAIDTKIEQFPNLGYFAVFDGHGGDTIARACSAQLLPAIVENITGHELSSDRLRDAVFKGFTQLDAHLGALETSDGPGSTAVVALVTPRHILVANIGDTRCVLVTGGKAVQLSRDHKPDLDSELKRIKKAGGSVSTHRVNGQLSVSRAFGDYSFKRTSKLPPGKQMVSAEPDIDVRARGAHDELLVLASDGVWDVIPIDYMCEVAAQIQSGVSVRHACERILEEALVRGSRDNMSVVIVALRL
eukprot:m.236157 g.236157  ORF g.236157 m.236157 type:complete len:330 (-) comp12936_c0_seq1:115-1104(-)